MIALSAAAVAQDRVPRSRHVVLIVEENHSFDAVVKGNAMSFLKSLIPQGGLATEFYADFHPSIGNYFMMTAGEKVTGFDYHTGTYHGPNLVRQMVHDKVSWKAYAQSLPDHVVRWDAGPYLRRHNPFSYFSDVIDDPEQRKNMVSAEQFSADLKSGALPAFSYLVPDRFHDAHNCPPTRACSDADHDEMAAADEYLSQVVPQILADPGFQEDGLLIVTWDESYMNDKAHGGGHIAVLLLGPKVKADYRSTTLYQHASTLRLICDALGLTACPGAGSTAPGMGEFFARSAAKPAAK